MTPVLDNDIDGRFVLFLNPHIAPLGYKVTFLRRGPNSVSMSLWKMGTDPRNTIYFRTENADPDDVLADLTSRVTADIRKNAR